MKRATLVLAALALLLGGVDQAKAGFMTLNDPSATGGTFAYGISGSNIVGWYSDGMGAHGFLYQPDVSAVPEPSSLTLLGVGALCLGGFTWRRRKSAAA